MVRSAGGSGGGTGRSARFCPRAMGGEATERLPRARAGALRRAPRAPDRSSSATGPLPSARSRSRGSRPPEPLPAHRHGARRSPPSPRRGASAPRAWRSRPRTRSFRSGGRAPPGAPRARRRGAVRPARRDRRPGISAEMSLYTDSLPMTSPPGMIPCAPGDPDVHDRASAGSLPARAQSSTAASTGPTPQTSPGWSQSSMSVAAMSSTGGMLLDPTTPPLGARRPDVAAPPPATPRPDDSSESVEERPRHATLPVVLPQHRGGGRGLELVHGEALPPAAAAQLDPARGTRVLHPVPFAVRGDEPALAADAERSRPESTRACRSCGPGPSGDGCVGPSARASRADARRALSRAAHRAQPIRPRRPLHTRSKAVHAETALARAVSALPGRDDPDQWASGRTLVIRIARSNPTARRRPSPNPMPSCDQSRSLPEPVASVEIG